MASLDSYVIQLYAAVRQKNLGLCHSCRHTIPHRSSSLHVHGDRVAQMCVSGVGRFIRPHTHLPIWQCTIDRALELLCHKRRLTDIDDKDTTCSM